MTLNEKESSSFKKSHFSLDGFEHVKDASCLLSCVCLCVCADFMSYCWFVGCVAVRLCGQCQYGHRGVSDSEIWREYQLMVHTAGVWVCVCLSPSAGCPRRCCRVSPALRSRRWVKWRSSSWSEPAETGLSVRRSSWRRVRYPWCFSTDLDVTCVCVCQVCDCRLVVFSSWCACTTT